MANPQVINKFGKLTGWADVEIELYGRKLEGITAVSYSDERTIEPVHGAGYMPVGFEEGNYTAQASITLYKDEVVALQRSLPPGTRLQDIPAFPVPVVYRYGTGIYKDVLQNVKFKSNGTELNQGEGKIEIQFDLFITHIDWNV